MTLFLLGENSSLIIDSEISRKKLLDLDLHEHAQKLQMVEKNRLWNMLLNYCILISDFNSVETTICEVKMLIRTLAGKGNEPR